MAIPGHYHTAVKRLGSLSGQSWAPCMILVSVGHLIKNAVLRRSDNRHFRWIDSYAFSKIVWQSLKYSSRMHYHHYHPQVVFSTFDCIGRLWVFPEDNSDHTADQSRTSIPRNLRTAHYWREHQRSPWHQSGCLSPWYATSPYISEYHVGTLPNAQSDKGLPQPRKRSPDAYINEVVFKEDELDWKALPHLVC